MLQIKKLKRYGKKSGNVTLPNHVSFHKSFGAIIINVSKAAFAVDRVTPKVKKAKKK